MKLLHLCPAHRIVGLSLAILTLSALQAQEPAWWTDQAIIEPGASATDYAPVTQGQLKFMASGARMEMGVNASPEIASLIDGWSDEPTQAKDYSVATVGQLKAVAKPFYQQLNLTYPWTTTSNDDSDFSIATIGQLKRVFNFNLSTFEINSPVSVSGNVGTTFIYRITATRPPTSFSTLNLPGWAALDPATGIIAGVPPTVGTFDFTIGASDFTGADTASVHLTILAAASPAELPVITVPASITGTQGVSFNLPITVSGGPGLSFSALNLPAGLLISPTTGTISGNPTKAGTYIALVSASNPNGTTTKVFEFVISLPAPGITSSLAASGVVGSLFTYQIEANNEPTSYTAETLPPGLALVESTGEIRGIPTQSGSYNVSISAQNVVAGLTASGTLHMDIVSASASPPVIQSATAVGTNINEDFSYRIVATNGPIEFDAANLPDGLHINKSDGTIRGAIAVPGSYSVTLSARNNVGTATTTLVITAQTSGPAVPVISSPLIVYTTAGQPFSYTIIASDSPTSYTVTNLPSGYSFNSATHTITATPSSVSTPLLTISATNAVGITSAPLLVVVGSATHTATVALDLQAGISPHPGYNTISASIEDNTAAPVFDSLCLDGLQVGNVENGAASTASSFPLGESAIQRALVGFDLSPLPPGATIATASLTLVRSVGSGNPSLLLQHLTVPFFPNAASWNTHRDAASDNTNPPLATQAVSSNDQASTWATSSAFTASVQSCLTAKKADFVLSCPTAENYPTGPKNYAQFYPEKLLSRVETLAERTRHPKLSLSYMTKYPPVIYPRSSLFAVDQPMSYRGGMLHVPNSVSTTFSATGLLPGVSLNTTTGIISGTPTTVGDYSVNMTATNGNGTSSGILTLKIRDLRTTGSRSAFFTFTLPSLAPSSFALAAGVSLPTGLTLNSTTGVISGVISPDASTGTQIYTVEVHDVNGTYSLPFSLTINPQPAVPPDLGGDVEVSATAHYPFEYSIYTSNPALQYYHSNDAPAWVNFVSNESYIYKLSGTPPNMGTWEFEVWATNAAGSCAHKRVTIIVSPPPIPQISPQTFSAVVGQDIDWPLSVDYPYTYSDLTISAPQIPSWLALDTSKSLQGIAPATAGVYTFNVTASSPYGQTTAPITVKVFNGPIFREDDPNPSKSGIVGRYFDYDISSFEDASSLTVANLPPGLEFQGDSGYGEISGTPTTTGVYTVPITATNSVGSTMVNLTITIKPVAVITSPLFQIARVGIPFSYSISTNIPLQSYQVEGLPDGLEDQASLIFGTPSAAGLQDVAISAEGGDPDTSVNETLTLAVLPSASDRKLDFQSQVVPFTSYGVPMAAIGSDSINLGTENIPETISSEIRVGKVTETKSMRGLLAFDVSNLPPEAIVTGATLSVTSAGGASVGEPLKVDVYECAQAFDPNTATWTNNHEFKSAALSYLRVNPATLTGNSVFYGTASFAPAIQEARAHAKIIHLMLAAPQAEAGDVAAYASFIGKSADGTLTPKLTVYYTLPPPTGPPVIISPTLVTGKFGVPFGYTISATNSPTSFSATGLPAGVSINTTTGLIQGTPSQVGSTMATISATNGYGTGTQTLTINIDGATPVQLLTKTDGDNQTGLPGGFLSKALEIQASAGGSPLPNTLVTFKVPFGGGTLALTNNSSGGSQSLTVKTDGNGKAAIFLKLPLTLGETYVSASAGAASPVMFLAAVAAGQNNDTASVILSLISGGGQNGPAGTILPKAFVVKATNAQGVPISGLPITFNVSAGGCSIGTSGGSAAASGLTPSTDGSGKVTLYLRPGAGPLNLVTGIAQGGQAAQSQVYLMALTRIDGVETPTLGGGGGVLLLDHNGDLMRPTLSISVPDGEHPENIEIHLYSTGSDIDEYVIEKKVGNGNWKEWKKVQNTEAEDPMEDSDLLAGTRYQYRAYAVRIKGTNREYSSPSNIAAYNLSLLKAISVTEKFYESNDTDTDQMDGHAGLGFGDWDDYGGPSAVLSTPVNITGGDVGRGEGERYISKYKFELNPSQNATLRWRELFQPENSNNIFVKGSYSWSTGGAETSEYFTDGLPRGTYSVCIDASLDAYDTGVPDASLDSSERSGPGAFVIKGGAGTFTVNIPGAFDDPHFTISYDNTHFQVLDSHGNPVSSGQYFYHSNGGSFTVMAKDNASYGDTTTVNFTAYDSNGSVIGTGSSNFVYKTLKLYSMPVDEASGAKYRKIALNGMPMPDQKPQKDPESDEDPEETFVDALTLGLRHSTTDVFIPIPGSDIALSARRDVRSEVWNMRSGLRPSESLDRPFGVCWSTNLAPNVHLVEAHKSAEEGEGPIDRTDFVEPDKVYVTDETGAVHTFYTWYTQGGDPRFFPMPTSKNEQPANLVSLSFDADGGLVFRKKYGTTLKFAFTDTIIKLPSDRLAGSEKWEWHRYARILSAQDRLGNKLIYQYEGGMNLVPRTITVANTNVSISILQNALHHITAIWDANGNKTSFTYENQPYDDGSVYFSKLVTVSGPEQTTTNYTYDFALDPDTTPHKTYDQKTAHWHCDLASITDALDHRYDFQYKFNRTRLNYMNNPEVMKGYYIEEGLPRTVSDITGPEGLHTQITNDSLVYIVYDPVNGGMTLQGQRRATVTDAQNFSRTYTFDQAQIFSIPKFSEEYKSNNMVDPKVICYGRLTIGHGNYGSEQFTFDSGAGMALSSATDLSGNTTTFAHGDPWTLGADDYRLILPLTDQSFNGYYGDPTSQTNAEGKTKSFAYTDQRIMKRVIDEEGRKTVYDIDALGRRTKESIYPANSTSVAQVTEFAYESSPFPGFITRKTIKRLPGSPSWAGDLVTTYEPDSNGRIGQEIVDPDNLNLSTSYKYDAEGNKVTATDPRGKTTWFSYDGRNQLITITHPDGSQKNFGYDATGNKTKEYDENGNLTIFVYDGLNRLTDQVRDMNANGTIDSTVDLVTHYTYNKVNSKRTEKDPRGYTTTYEYDDIQRLKKEKKDGLTGETKYEYTGPNSGGTAFDSSSFKPTKITDPQNYVTTLVYDKLYRLTDKQVGYAPNKVSTTSTRYDAVGNPVRVIDPLRRETKTDYDPLNRPIWTTYADHSASRIAYTSTGLKWKVTDENSHSTETIYDAAGRAVEIVGPSVDDGTGAVARPHTKFDFDRAGNVIRKTDPRGNVTDSTYDACNRKIADLLPSLWDAEHSINVRPVLRWRHDPAGREVATITARGGQTDKVYDAANRLTDVYEPLVPVTGGGSARPHTHTTYDKNGNPLTIDDPNSAYDSNGNPIVGSPDRHVTTNAYDELNRLETTWDAEGNEVTYDYDDSGNRTDVWDGRNKHTGFAYDGLNRNTVVTDHTGRPVTFAYDALNKVSRTDSENRVTTYQYDVRERLWQVLYAGRSIDNRVYLYDNVGNLRSVTEAGKNGRADVAYSYDALNRQISEQSGGLTHIYSYDLAGNRVRTVFGGTGKVLQSEYDAVNRLKTLTENPDGPSSRQTGYEYDLNGNTLRKFLPNGDRITSTYDLVNRVSSLSAATAASTSLYNYGYGYDLAGNLKSIDETRSGGIASRAVVMIYDHANRLKTETVTANAATVVTGYTYDAGNNRETRTVTGGPSPGTTTYHYNDLNQLTSTTGVGAHTYTYDLNGNRTARSDEDTLYQYDYENRLVSAFDVDAGDRSWDYVYDYRSRRVGITEHDGPLATVTKIVFSGGTSAQEYTVSGATNTLAVEYVRGSDFGGGVGGILYTLRGTTPSYTHSDRRGDIVAKTNASGAVTYAASYQAFSKRTQESGSTADRQKANSKDEDPTGFLNEGMRYRDLETGVFITRDPAGFVDGPNLYAYVVQNPWTKFDPEGLDAFAFYQLVDTSKKHSDDQGALIDAAVNDMKFHSAPPSNVHGFNNGQEILKHIQDMNNITTLDFHGHSYPSAIGGNGSDTGIYADYRPIVDKKGNPSPSTEFHPETIKGWLWDSSKPGGSIYVSELAGALKGKLGKNPEIKFLGCNSAYIAHMLSEELVKQNNPGVTVVGATNRTGPIESHNRVVGREVVKDTPSDADGIDIPNLDARGGTYQYYKDGKLVHEQQKITWRPEDNAKKKD